MFNRRISDNISIPGDYQFNALISGYAPQRFWHQTKYIEARKLLAPNSGDMILDVGCGSGVFASQLAMDHNVSVIGIDSNEAAINFARKQFKKPNVTFMLGYIDQLQFSNNSINRIALLEVIEHIYPEQTLISLLDFYRILQTGGRLVISTPNAKSFWPIIEFMLDNLRIIPKLSVDQHVSSYDNKEIVELANQAGFRLVKSKTINGIAPWISIFNWKLAERFHKFEQRIHIKYGNILLVCFEKKQ